AAEQGQANARKALDELNNGKTATPSKGDTTASESNALAQAGIPPIPSGDEWVFISKLYEEGLGYLEFYVAPSTIVYTRKPNGFKIWHKLKGSIFLATVFSYTQFDCDKQASRILASKGKDVTGENFEIKTNLWVPATDDLGSKTLLNYCQ
ncbi:MAG: hypothetical protein P9F19_10525, partial [Candidatus Contendobacter sp.]|nr:hypothetical protein [Candidatus Contendobacter sp.]